MSPWLSWGIPVIVWLQSLGDWLVVPMKVFSFLGDDMFYMLVMPAILWCFDSRLGIRLGLILLSCEGVNSILKVAFGLPRPFWVSDQVRAFSAESSFGLPSGHAQDAVAVWGLLAARLRKRWAYLGLAALIFLVSISRLYLGVHFPADVLAGWAAGVVLLALFLIFEHRVEEWLASLPLTTRLGAALAASLLLLSVGLLVVRLTSERPIPTSWFEAAAAAYPDDPAISPRSAGDTVRASGALFGLASGAILLQAWGGFRDAVTWRQRYLRFLVGVFGVAVLYFGLSAIFPAGESLLAQVLRYVRYALVGLWAAYLGPRAFVRFGLA